MSWSMEGTYFESCNCDVVCPCSWSGLARGATHDRCHVVLGFHIDRGNVEGVDVSGFTFGVVVDSPKQMTDGGWRVGVLIDSAASDEQAAKIQAVAAGQLGGPMAGVGPLVGEILGVERVPVTYAADDGTTRVSFGDVASFEIAVQRSIEGKDMLLNNVPHPANSTLAIAPTRTANVTAFGIDIAGQDLSGLAGTFSWSV